MLRLLNIALGLSVSIAAYKELIGLGVAILTGIYMIIQICIGLKKLLKKS